MSLLLLFSTLFYIRLYCMHIQTVFVFMSFTIFLHGVFLVLYSFSNILFYFQFVRTKCKIHVNKKKVFMFSFECTKTSKSFSISLFLYFVVVCVLVSKLLSPVCECKSLRTIRCTLIFVFTLVFSHYFLLQSDTNSLIQ